MIGSHRKKCVLTGTQYSSKRVGKVPSPIEGFSKLEVRTQNPIVQGSSSCSFIWGQKRYCNGNPNTFRKPESFFQPSKVLLVQSSKMLLVRLLVAQYPDHLSGTILVVDVNNTTMFHAFRKGRVGDERVHDLITSLFWLQVDSAFTLKLKWVYSADNRDADDLTRPEAVEHVRLKQWCFGRLWGEWGGFDMDLMATGTSV